MVHLVPDVMKIRPHYPEEADLKIYSLEGLKPYVGKVVKFTRDMGSTWNYIYVDQLFFNLPGQTAQKYGNVTPSLAGIKCYPEKTIWKNRSIEVPIFLTPEFFSGYSYGETFRQGSYFQLANFAEFKNRSFCGPQSQLTENEASKPCGDHPWGEIIARAPLTIVRSDKKTELKVSIFFNEKFSPAEPIVPSPSTIEKTETGQKYTWSITTNEDGTLTTADQQKIQMIWWEAIRKEKAPQPLDTAQTVCIPRAEFKEFLNQVLEKSGVSPKESDAFVSYWDKVLVYMPFVRMQRVEAEKLGEYLPQMEVESKDSLALERVYFRFEPTTQREGMNGADYLAQLGEKHLGQQAVIDLGGETTDPSLVTIADDFNEQFIKQYIYC